MKNDGFFPQATEQQQKTITKKINEFYKTGMMIYKKALELKREEEKLSEYSYGEEELAALLRESVVFLNKLGTEKINKAAENKYVAAITYLKEMMISPKASAQITADELYKDGLEAYEKAQKLDDEGHRFFNCMKDEGLARILIEDAKLLGELGQEKLKEAAEKGSEGAITYLNELNAKDQLPSSSCSIL
ncbi:MAG: hypothetical protein WBE18_04230 [Gammaproteobacteria bacterium]